MISQGVTESKPDSTIITITLGQYRMMTTCIAYLDECEQLRSVDSIQIGLLKADIIGLTNENYQLQNDLHKEKPKKIKWFLGGFGSGILLSLVLLRG